jgi:hypothetical protein
MAHRTSGLNKILVPPVNFRPTGKFLAILSVKFPLKSKHNERSAPVKVAILISTAGALAVAVLGTTIPRASNLQYFATL